MKTNYAEIDNKILALIEEGCADFHAIDTELRPLIKALPPKSFTDEWRVTDRRLQALRRAGRIEYSPANLIWRIIPVSGETK